MSKKQSVLAALLAQAQVVILVITPLDRVIVLMLAVQAEAGLAMAWAAARDQFKASVQEMAVRQRQANPAA